MELSILGPLEVVAAGRPLELGAPRQRALLAILALHAGEVVSMDRLIDLLWGDRPPAAAIGSLQAYVSNLRRILEPDRAPRQAASVLVTQAPGYVLRMERDSVDALRFEGLAEDGRSLLNAGQAGAAAASLAQALGLWRGEALADFRHEDFAIDEANRLDEIRLSAHEDHIDAQLRLGRHAATLPVCERLVAQHPLREHLRALHMVALYRAGRQADALRAYDAARRALVEELGVEPGPELASIHRQVLQHDERLRWDRPAEDRHPPGGAAPEADRVASPPAPAPRADRPGGGLAFVGRRQALLTLLGAFEGSDTDRPRIALVGGEPGIGKTRLAEEVAHHALGQGALVAWGRSHDEGMPPLWPWTAVARPLLPEGRRTASLPELLGLDDLAGGPADSELNRFRIYDRVREVVEQRAERSPVVVILDDLQWADPPSLRLLRFLAAELTSSNVFLIGLFHEPDRSDSPLAATLADLARRPGVERLTLGGLEPDDVRELIGMETAVEADALEATTAALHQRTGGNPFFLTELVRLLASEHQLGRPDERPPYDGGDIPLVVSDVIRRRLQRLPDDLRVVLGVAAVIGSEVEMDVLHRVVGLGEDETFELLEVAVMSRLVVEPHPGRFAFSHGLVRDTLYRDLGRGRRARLHARVADAIETVHGAHLQPHVEQLAHHSVAAHDAARTARYAELAAEEAERTSSFDAAVGYWERALGAQRELAVASPPPRAAAARAGLLLRLAAAHRGAGDASSAADAHGRALTAAEEADDVELLAEAALAYGEVVLWQVTPYGTVDRRVVQALERALEATPAEDHLFRARLLTGLAVAIYYEDTEHGRSRELAREAVATARRAGDPQVLVPALVELIVMLDGEPDLVEQLARADELESILDGGADVDFEVAATSRMRITRVRFVAGDGSQVEPRIAAVADQATDARHHVTSLWARWAETGLAFVRGRLEEAEARAGRAFEVHQQLGLWGGPETYGMHMILIWREQDRLAEVRPLVQPLLEQSHHPGARKLWGLFLLDEGALDEVARVLGDDPRPRSRDFTWLAEVCVTAELAAAAAAPCREELYELLAPFDGRLVTMDGTWVCYGATTHYRGLLAASLGRHEAAVAHLEDAVRLHDRAGAVPWAARSRLHLAAALGGGTRAEEVRAEALESATAHGLVALRRSLVTPARS